MMKLFLLLFMVGSARSHPLLNECDSENQKALSCQREISEKFGSFFSYGFHVNSLAIAEFKRCFGEPVCTVSTKKLQLLNIKISLYNELAVLSPCVSEDRYRDAKNNCSSMMKQNCNYDGFFSCMTVELEQLEGCRPYEIAKFEELQPSFESYCVLKKEIKSLLSYN